MEDKNKIKTTRATASSQNEIRTKKLTKSKKHHQQKIESIDETTTMIIMKRDPYASEGCPF